MKNALIHPAAIILILIALPSPASADGMELKFFLADGKEMKGELLSVRSESFMIALHPGRLEEELRRFPEGVIELPRERVVSVEIPGRSNVLLGIGIGCIAGGIIGGALATADDPDNLGESIAEPFAAAGGATIGALAGMGVGVIVGLSTSSDDRIVDLGILPDLEFFRPYARYQDEEPEFLGGASR